MADFRDLTSIIKQLFEPILRKPKVYRLGHPLRVDSTDPITGILNQDTDSAGMVWVHGYNFPSTPDVFLVSNYGPGRMRDDELIYGTPVYVTDTIDGPEIYGPAGRLTAEYLHTVKIPEQRAIQLNQFDVALVQPADDLTSVTVSRFFLPVQGQYRYIQDARVSLPSTPLLPNQAVVYRIEVSVTTGSIRAVAGEVYSFDTSTMMPNHEDAYEDFYPIVLDDEYIPLGFVRLYHSQDIVRRTDILAAQSLFGSGKSAEPINPYFWSTVLPNTKYASTSGDHFVRTGA